jgi:hypothetical protein
MGKTFNAIYSLIGVGVYQSLSSRGLKIKSFGFNAFKVFWMDSLFTLNICRVDASIFSDDLDPTK